MCDFDTGFKLCTCGEKLKFRKEPLFHKVKGKLVPLKTNKKQPPLQNIWMLYRLKGMNKEFELGSYMMPDSDLGNGLNAELIQLHLNHGDCFDFEYIPNEGDNLFFQQNIEFGPYISFVFQNRLWEEKHYSPFDEITEKINEGLIKALYKEV